MGQSKLESLCFITIAFAFKPGVAIHLESELVDYMVKFSLGTGGSARRVSVTKELLS